MRKSVVLLCFIILAVLSSMSVLAASKPLEINLQGPKDGITTANFKVEFVYGFNQVPNDVASCALVIDGEEKVQRQNLFAFDNNKMSFEFAQGKYVWGIRCTSTDGTVTNSAERTVTVNGEVTSKEGYDTIYNNNGLRSYLISISSGQDPVDLPAMKGGEGIQIRTTKTTYYIDLLKMGSTNGVYFGEVRDRTASKIYKIMTTESKEFDFDGDKVVDVKLTLKRTNTAVDAFFTVAPYPGSEPVEETPEQPVETPTTPDEETTTETSVPSTPTQPVETPSEPVPPVETTPETPAVSVSEEAAPAKSSLSIILIVAAILAIGLIAYFAIKGKSSKAAVSAKKAPPKESKPSSSESFDVIKSTSAPKRK